MRRNGFTMVMLGCLMMASGARAAEQNGAAEFDRVKALVGTWRGPANEGAMNNDPVTVEYRLTSGGSAVVETLFPGTSHEMVSVYHQDHGKLAMTHYCLMGNQPKLQEVAANDQQIELQLSPDSGLDPSSPHMHALTIAWADPNHITQTWTSYEQGQPKEKSVFTLARATTQ